MPFTLSTPAFPPGGPIPRTHTGDGDDLSPPLEWAGIPDGTQAFALVVDDPDAPTAEPWVHWLAWNLPADATALPGGFRGPTLAHGAPRFVQGINTWGGPGWRGPAPPRGHGPHRYRFQLHALDAPLDLPPGADRKTLRAALDRHTLDRAELVGLYERK